MSSATQAEQRRWLSEDHWQVLGLEPGADADSLKRAFRQQARRWHPDLNANDPAAEERFKRINEAYAVLSDPQRRRAWESGQDVGAGEDGTTVAFASGFPRFEEYLAELFAPRHGRRDDRVGWAAAAASDTTEHPAAEAADREPLNRATAERSAAGPAADERASGVPDDVHHSAGSVTPSPASPPPVQVVDDLESVVELTPDQALAGDRVELALADGTLLEVWTPPLAGDGWRLRLAGVGPSGADHFLQLRVRTPEGLRIDGLRVLYRLDLHPADAALGCQVVVPTLEGPVRLRVPAGSSSGRLLRLRGRGQRWGESCGDQLVEIRIVIDPEPDEAEQALYRRLRELDQERRAG